ncbi:3-oxoacyl-ACP reductase family protein [Neorhizobium sp. CSC1952]|uniref:3-oxoacyl-ACP reductase family protein n=1 Tax=Neorhizobium TaxID=1525371 RepID=UPI0025A5076D|nr:3-oxoacyl-ACP reductase family protein [Rhizobium sp. CSC1952]WJR67107.1 3-oxoacyl-ACP reductase family protein [Rhizobium sp. CSC1952]
MPSSLIPPLAGKAALVTGGSRGIGAAIVRRLAQDGAAVAFTYSASSERAAALVAEIETEGGKARAIRADSADVDAVKAAVAEAAKAFSRIDILVNNAGILIRNLVDDYDPADFDRMFAVNVRAPFIAIQAALPHMRSGGRIITTGSVTADRSGFPGASVYSMTKGAVASMTRGLARDLGPRGITVNAVQPGPTATDMNSSEEGRALTRPLMAIGRVGEDHEVASLVAYLAGPESSFITGSALTIDGGYLA